VIPFEEGIIEVRVAVTANPLVNEMLLFEALIVNATDVSAGVIGGVGVVVPPPSEDLEQEMIEPITIGSKKIIFFIFICYHHPLK
jgi:hypothetical protein